MKELTIKSTNNKDNLHVYIWETEGNPKAIVQLSHGMQEHLGRYDDFAKELSKNGIMVIGNDHLGHGLTVKSDDDLGYFGEGKSKTVVDDLHAVTEYAKKNYGKEIPIFLFGHSMGSFMARRYIMTYGSELNGAIICGTGGQPKVVLAGGRFIAFMIGLFKGQRYRSNLIKGMAFGAYNKRIPDAKSKEAWLTKVPEVIEKYEADKFCTFNFTIDGYKTLFESIAFIQKKSNINNIPKELPIFLVAGADDPVGNYGKGVKSVYESYKKLGVKDINIKLYETDRHEILNETDREDVYKDIVQWINTRV